MKKILGLDLGSASVGWAVIEEQDNQNTIVALGSRIIPLSTDDATQFSKGQAITKNADRTAKRTQRKGYDRYQLRRQALAGVLRRLDMHYDDALVGLKPLELWGLRAKAVSEQISLPELGRVLFHLNQKRGYKSGKEDYASKKQTDYVQSVNGRYDMLRQRQQTIGQYFFEQLAADVSYRCKDQVFPRAAYLSEFDAIIACQQPFYSETLTDAVVGELRNNILYYQRRLKSCKHLVAICEFEKRAYLNANGAIVYRGPKVAPRTSPLFQVCKIWESINNLAIKNRVGEELHITMEQKQALFEFMNTHEKLKLQDLYKMLNISKADGWWGGKAVGTGLQGNTTRCAIEKALGSCSRKAELLRFDLHLQDGTLLDEATGEILPVIAPDLEEEPLYRLWHVLYSISDMSELKAVLQQQFAIEQPEVIEALCLIDFVKAGYGNKSVRVMRRIIPNLQQGVGYSVACEMAGFRHSQSLSISENSVRELSERIKIIEKGALRQPIVEKILNQMINLVNALMAEYGCFDEIRVELARELKQSRDERESATTAMRANQAENDKNAQLIAQYQLTPTRTRLQKYKMWIESGKLCMYCGQSVGVVEFLQGFDVEVEHIIPRSLLFDDSFSNKVCSCRACNQEKNNRTAYNYMLSKGDASFQEYIDRVNTYYKEHKISKTKFGKLLMPEADIPTDFIERQLRESQYIARKAKELLQEVCRNVYATSGSVTDFIRHVWGWDQVLHHLNLSRYRNAGLVEIKQVNHAGVQSTQERIKDWSKRLDHRHHAVDALVIACTRQGYIQRINNLSSLKEEPSTSFAAPQKGCATRHTLLERYLLAQPHFSMAEVADAVDQILISFKAGKRVATLGKRYVNRGGKRVLMQQGVVVPRGALSEESVYGRIKKYEKDKKGRIQVNEQYIIKYPIQSIDRKALKSVVDIDIQRRLQERLELFDGNVSKAYAEPVKDHQERAIRSVRCYTGLTAVVPVKHNQQGEPIGFVKPGNNHHVAVYVDREGVPHEHIVTFWHAVERKKQGIPVVIDHPDQVWDQVTEQMSESFLMQLPDATWSLRITLQQNEMFILGMEEDAYRDAIACGDYAVLNKHLYRVQKLTSRMYVFRYHIETSVDDKYNGEKNEMLSLKMGKFRRATSLGALEALNPHKVRITLLGKIEEL